MADQIGMTYLEGITPKNIFYSTIGIIKKAFTMAEGYRVKEAGYPFGVITASGKIALCKYTQLAASVAQGATQIEVDDPTPWKVGDAIKVGTESATTVQAIDEDNNLITLADAIADAAGQAVGAAVVGTDGSEVARGFFYNPVSSVDGDIRVTCIVGGHLISDKLKNFYDQTVTDLGGKLDSALKKFSF